MVVVSAIEIFLHEAPRLEVAAYRRYLSHQKAPLPFPLFEQILKQVVSNHHLGVTAERREAFLFLFQYTLGFVPRYDWQYF